jgi:hypothetical protein
VRPVHVCSYSSYFRNDMYTYFHSSYFRYGMYTYVITARTSGTTYKHTLSQIVCHVQHLHIYFRILYARYDIYTYVITACISDTIYIHMLSQLSFQVRHKRCVITPYTSRTIYIQYIHLLSQLVFYIRHIGIHLSYPKLTGLRRAHVPE